ncbi:MAG: exodeoxyribonuclease VII small subunit [Planctomycetota bacterium]
MSKKAPSFEQAVDQLEGLIEQIESGEIGLEDALKRYEDGTKLIQRCRSILDSAEKKIAELTEDQSISESD